MVIAANGGSGKPYDWRDVTKVPRRNAGEEAKAEAAKAARESERAEADRDFAEAVAAGETRQIPVFDDSVPCRHCGEPFQQCICRMPDETQEDHIARVTQGTGRAAVVSDGTTYLTSVKGKGMPDNIVPFKKPHTSSEIGLARLADVAMKPVDWLWTNHLARGKLTILSGPSELGKSTISIDIAARLSLGGKWPDSQPAPTGSTVILSSEDAVNDTIAPRATAAGANLENIYCLAFVKTDGISRTFSLQNDLQRLGERIRAIGNVHLVIIDPVT